MTGREQHFRWPFSIGGCEISHDAAKLLVARDAGKCHPGVCFQQFGKLGAGPLGCGSFALTF